MPAAPELQELEGRVTDLERQMREFLADVQAKKRQARTAWQQVADRWPDDEVAQRAYQEVQKIMRDERDAEKKTASAAYDKNKESKAANGKRSSISGRSKARKAG